MQNGADSVARNSAALSGRKKVRLQFAPFAIKSWQRARTLNREVIFTEARFSIQCFEMNDFVFMYLY
jgi:hypothetical protein